MKNSKQITTKEKTEYRVPKLKQPVYKFVRPVLKLFYRKPANIVSLSGDLPTKAIFVARHAAKKGPMIYDLHFPVITTKWGAGEMFGNYKSRWGYLRNIFYMKKRKFSKFKSTTKASFEAIFSKFFYRGMRMLPTFTDNRLAKTVNMSIQAIDDGIGVMVFPEDSNDGYKDVLTGFFPGFVLLAQQYYKKKGEDLPIYPVHYHDKKKIISIGNPEYCQNLISQGMNKTQIAEYFCNKVNELHYMCENGDFDKK